MKTVCFVGASTVEGMGDEEGLGWPGRLWRIEQSAQRGFVGYNLGIRSQTLREMSARAAAECQVRLAGGPGAIVLGTGANDIARVGSLLRTTAYSRRAAFVNLCGLLRQLAPLLVVGPMPVAESRMPVYDEAGLAYDFRNADIAEASADYAAACAEMGIPYADLYSPLSASPVFIASVTGRDGLHPDGAGYEETAKLIASCEEWRKL